MMVDDRDWGWLSGPAAVSPTYQDHLLWALIKGDRRAECHVRQLPHGAELRVSAGGELVWSRVFTSLALLEEATDKHRRAFEDLGWRTPGPRLEPTELDWR